MRYPRRLLLLAAPILVLAALMASCDDNSTEVLPTPTGTVTFYFDNTVDGAPLVMDTLLNYTNPSGTQYNISNLKYVISDLTLHRSNGQTFGMDGIHYRDQANDNTRSITVSDIPTGTYDMVSFTFGLDEEKNVRDRYLNYPYDFHVAMEWPSAMGGDMGIGYHYMKLEGNYEVTPTPEDTSTAGYTTHLGARWLADGNPMTGVADPYPYHHFFRVYLPIPATALDDTPRGIVITMDANKWYDDPDTGDDFDSEYDWHDLASQAIMANLDAQKKLMINGPHCFSATVETP
jgi:hypothetical protein